MHHVRGLRVRPKVFQRRKRAEDPNLWESQFHPISSLDSLRPGAKVKSYPSANDRAGSLPTSTK